MPRIVKADAKELIVSQVEGDKVFLKLDTIEIKKGWRPEGYKNPTPAVILPSNVDNPYGEDALHEAYEAGFDACIEAMENQK